MSASALPADGVVAAKATIYCHGVKALAVRVRSGTWYCTRCKKRISPMVEDHR